MVLLKKNLHAFFGVAVMLFCAKSATGTEVANQKGPNVFLKHLLTSGFYNLNKGNENNYYNRDEQIVEHEYNRVNYEDKDGADKDDTESEDNADEIMKTSEQIPFRPLFRRYIPAVVFRHKQMMEERKKRKEMRRRESSEQSDLNRRVANTASSNAYAGEPIFICYGQTCRPISALDIRRLQLLQPKTRFYQQTTEPGTYYNAYSFRTQRK